MASFTLDEKIGDETAPKVDEYGDEIKETPTPTPTPTLEVTGPEQGSFSLGESVDEVQLQPGEADFRQQQQTTSDDGGRLKAALYSATNGFTMGLADEGLAAVKSQMEKIPYDEALQSLSDYQQDINSRYPVQSAFAEGAGAMASMSLGAAIPGVKIGVSALSAGGRAALLDLVRKYGGMAAAGATYGYTNAPYKNAEKQDGITSALIGGVSAPAVGVAMSGAMRGLQLVPASFKKLIEWWMTKRAPEGAKRQQLKEALDYYAKSFKGGKSSVDEITEASARDTAQEIAESFSTLTKDIEAKQADIATFTNELKLHADAARELRDVTRGKLEAVEIPESIAQKTMESLDWLQSKINSEAEKGFAALKGETITLSDVLKAIRSAKGRLRGFKGFSMLDETSAENVVSSIAAKVKGQFSVRNEQGKLVLRDNPENIEVPMEMVKGIVKTLDRNLDDWYQSAAGQYKSELAGNPALKQAFADIRRDLSAGLKEGNEVYRDAMERATKLQSVRRDMLDILKWRTDKTRDVRSAMEAVALRTTQQEQAALDAFAEVAAGSSVTDAIAQYTAARNALKNVDDIFSWGRYGADLEESIAKLQQIKDILPAEHGRAKTILEELVRRDNWMAEAEQQMLDLAMKNKDLLTRASRESVQRASKTGGKIPRPQPQIGSEAQARAFVDRATKPGAMTAEDDAIARALQESGYTGKDLLTRLMDIKTDKILNTQHIRGSRAVVASQAIGGATGGMIGRDALSAAVGQALGAALGYTVEQFGANASRTLFRYFLKKQMAWSKGISKIPLATALAGSDMVRHQIMIRRDEPEYQMIMKEMLNDKSLSSAQKLETMRANKNGIKIELE